MIKTLCKRFFDSSSDNPKSTIQKRPRGPKWVGIFALAFTFAAWGAGAQAQQPAKIPRIGLLRTGSSPDPLVDAFRHGLQKLGYVEGKNILIEYRWAERRDERLPDLAADLVRLKVDVIVVGGNVGIRAAMKATKTIPIVMTSVGDPVGLGLVANLARPGGNVTGLSQLAPDLTGKRLELLNEILPKATRVAYIRDPDNPGMTLRFKEAQVAANALGIKLHSLNVRSRDELTTAFAASSKEHVDALMVPAPIAARYEKQIADYAEKKACRGRVIQGNL